MSKRVRSGITVSNRVGKPGVGYAEEKGAACGRAPVIRSRTSCSPAANSALRIRTSWSKRCVRHEPGLCFLDIGNNTRGRLQWKWQRQIDLVAWALPVVCEHRTSCRQTQSAKLGIPKRVNGWDRSGEYRSNNEVLWNGLSRLFEGDSLQCLACRVNFPSQWSKKLEKRAPQGGSL